jgi:hypothetical protein
MNERHRDSQTRRTSGTRRSRSKATDAVPAVGLGGEPPLTGNIRHSPYFTTDGELVISKEDFERWREGRKEEGSKENSKVVYVAHMGPDRMLNLGCEGGIDSRRPIYFNSDGCLVISEEDFERHWMRSNDGRTVRVKPELGPDRKINLGCGGPVEKGN